MKRLYEGVKHRIVHIPIRLVGRDPTRAVHRNDDPFCGIDVNALAKYSNRAVAAVTI